MQLFNIPLPMIKYTLGNYMKPESAPALPTIDNRMLDGFLEFFEKKSCAQSSCEDCKYCERIAGKVVSINAEVKETADCFAKALDDVISGKAIMEGPF